jgi:hypothetical protein
MCIHLSWCSTSLNSPNSPLVRKRVKFGSPGRIRTCDQPVNSQLLYQLSYRGMRQSVVRQRTLAKVLLGGRIFSIRQISPACV